MAKASRRSKEHRHGIVLTGKYNKSELEKLMNKHKSSNVLYISPNAIIDNNSKLPTKIRSIRLHWKNKNDLDSVLEKFGMKYNTIDIEETKENIKVEEENGDE